MAEIPLTAAIVETYARYDPDGVTVAVGGSALYLQMHEAGLQPPHAAGVDVISSGRYIQELLEIGPCMADISTFQVSYPSADGLPHVDITPDRRKAPARLPFSAVRVAGPVERPWRYVDLWDTERVAQLGSGVTCLNIAEVLEMQAIGGRAHDVAAVAYALPLVYGAGLISEIDHARIRGKVAAPAAHRATNKNSHHFGGGNNRFRYGTG